MPPTTSSWRALPGQFGCGLVVLGAQVLMNPALADLDLRVLVEQQQRREARTAAQIPVPTLTPNSPPVSAAPDAPRRDPIGSEEAGELFAQAVAYDRGQGSRQNLEDAARLYQQAAELGHLEAQMNIGLMYTQGQGVPRDDRAGAKWLGQAAQSGNAVAQYSYGLMLYEGRGIKQNYAQAMRWYRRSAELGNAKAMNNIGIMTALGHGVKESNIDAFAWFSVAAERGETDAISNRDLTGDVLSATERLEAERTMRRIRNELGM